MAAAAAATVCEESPAVSASDGGRGRRRRGRAGGCREEVKEKEGAEAEGAGHIDEQVQLTDADIHSTLHPMRRE